jgi:hypothetical protein
MTQETNEPPHDNWRERLPWTRDQLTLAEFEQWIATREEAGRAIDIETCELARWPAYDEDPYGIRRARGEEPYDQVGTNRWVRSPESDGWIWEGDLPPEKGGAMYDRIRREHAQWEEIDRLLQQVPLASRVKWLGWWLDAISRDKEANKQ